METVGTRNEKWKLGLKMSVTWEGVIPRCIAQPLNPQAKAIAVISSGLFFKYYSSA